MAADVFVDPHDRGVPLRPAQMQRLEHEGGDVEIANPAAIRDLLHLHVAVACRAPSCVGVGLVARIAVEVADTIVAGATALVLNGGAAERRWLEDENGCNGDKEEAGRSNDHPSNLTPESQDHSC